MVGLEQERSVPGPVDLVRVHLGDLPVDFGHSGQINFARMGSRRKGSRLVVEPELIPEPPAGSSTLVEPESTAEVASVADPAPMNDLIPLAVPVQSINPSRIHIHSDPSSLTVALVSAEDTLIGF